MAAHRRPEQDDRRTPVAAGRSVADLLAEHGRGTTAGSTGASTTTTDPVHGPAEPAPSPLRLALRRVGSAVVTLVLLVSTLAFLFLAVGPHVLGYRTAGMLTGSMSPYIDPGDVVVDTSLPASQIRPGMVLTYQIPVDDHRTVSHRVRTVTANADGTVSFTTKGDANAGDDPWTAVVPATQTMWQVRAVVPHLNSVIRVLRDTVAQRWFVVGLPLAIAAWLVVDLWRPKRDEQSWPTDDATDDATGAEDDDVADVPGTGTEPVREQEPEPVLAGAAPAQAWAPPTR